MQLLTCIPCMSYSLKDEVAEFLGGILSQSSGASMDTDTDADVKRRRKRKVPREEIVSILQCAVRLISL